MNKIFLAGLVAGLLTTQAFANSPDICGPDGPEAYKRAGGYCETVRANGSLSETSTQGQSTSATGVIGVPLGDPVEQPAASS